MAFKMKNQSMAKLTKAAGDSRVAMKMKAESAMKMKEKSPMEKELVGKQGNLPPELKAKIEAAPSKMKSAMKKNGDDAKIKALQARLAKAMKEGNDREISAIRLELQQLYKVEKKAKDNSPTKMKEKSAMKDVGGTTLPEVRITGKKEEKKKRPNKVTKDLKYPYSRNRFGDLMYKGDIIDEREAAQIPDSDLYEYNPVKPTKKGDSAVPMKEEFKKMPTKKAPKSIDQYSKVSGLQITSDGKEVRQSMAGPAGKTLVNERTNREIDRDYRAKNQPKAKVPEDYKGKKKRRTKRFERRAMKS